MTNQELYSTVRTHLLTQMAKSLWAEYADDTRCAYRGAGGLKCAIGIIIPDASYNRALESKSAYNYDVRAAGGYDVTVAKLASALQHIHDNHDPINWQQQLDQVAEEFGLVAS